MAEDEAIIKNTDDANEALGANSGENIRAHSIIKAENVNVNT